MCLYIWNYLTNIQSVFSHIDFPVVIGPDNRGDQTNTAGRCSNETKHYWPDECSPIASSSINAACNAQGERRSENRDDEEDHTCLFSAVDKVISTAAWDGLVMSMSSKGLVLTSWCWVSWCWYILYISFFNYN